MDPGLVGINSSWAYASTGQVLVGKPSKKLGQTKSIPVGIHERVQARPNDIFKINVMVWHGEIWRTVCTTTSHLRWHGQCCARMSFRLRCVSPINGKILHLPIREEGLYTPRLHTQKKCNWRSATSTSRSEANLTIYIYTLFTYVNEFRWSTTTYWSAPGYQRLGDIGPWRARFIGPHVYHSKYTANTWVLVR